MTNTENPRTAAIINLATSLDMDPISTVLDILDMVPGSTTPLHALVRDSFTGDDDADELIHEIEHAMGECTDDNAECMWNDND